MKEKLGSIFISPQSREKFKWFQLKRLPIPHLWFFPIIFIFSSKRYIFKTARARELCVVEPFWKSRIPDKGAVVLPENIPITALARRKQWLSIDQLNSQFQQLTENTSRPTLRTTEKTFCKSNAVDFFNTLECVIDYPSYSYVPYTKDLFKFSVRSNFQKCYYVTLRSFV